MAPSIVKKSAKEYVLRVDPWQFAYFVAELWRTDPTLHDELSEYPFGKIYSQKQWTVRWGAMI